MLSSPELGQAEETKLVMKVLPPEEKRNIILQAVRDGTPISLRVLGAQVLSGIPDYRKTLLPDIKEEALSSLLSRFREVDWANWQASSFARDGGPTLARSYVDLINSVNTELGEYLETAAILFSRLAVDTAKRKVFEPEKELISVLREPQNPLGQGSGQFLQADSVLDANILDDSTFASFIERLRARVVGQHLETFEGEPLEAFALLLSVRPEFMDEELEHDLLVLLRQFALEASPRYRDEVFRMLRKAPVFAELGQDRQALRRALAELYLIGVIDAIDRKDRPRAALYMDESIALVPDLHSQELLRPMLEANTFSNVANSAPSSSQERALDSPKREQVKSEAATNSSFDLVHKEQKNELENSLKTGISFLSLLIIGLVIVAAGFYVFVYLRSVRNLADSPARTYKPPIRPQVRMTPASEMDFDSEFAYEGESAPAGS